MTSDVTPEIPPRAYNTNATTEDLYHLIEAAIGQKGEWFSLPIPDGSKTSNIHTRLKQIVGTKLSEVRVVNGKVYLRIRA